MPARHEDPALWLQLIRSRRIGPVTFHRIVAEHGGVEAALKALPDIAKASGVTDYEVCPIGVVRHELAQGRAAKANLLLFGQFGYPQSLMDLDDAPPILWAQGDITLLARPMVALVGARNASSLGLRMARRLAEGLGAAGQVVVSGLARGVDAEVHQATLSTGTVAVQAGGVDVIYPTENADLAAQILTKGCRVSEQPMGMEPQSRHFPLRNRIISGLARGVVVVEAAAKSGSLITAEAALEQGREVFAVPGHPFDARAAGCNRLIRDGATLVRGAQDIFDVLGITGKAPVPQAEAAAEPEVAALPDPLPGPVPPRRSLLDIAAIHSRILARLGPSSLAEDQLIRDLAMPAAALSSELLSLELDGKIERQSGGLISRR
jgi:DNA processing protein